jgi:hypothetical protein
MSSVKSLSAAKKIYSTCANLTEANLAVPNQPSAVESEQLIAFGIAADWVQRAALLQPLVYNGNLLSSRQKVL